MASVFNVLRTCSLIIYILFNVQTTVCDPTEPWIVSFTVNEISCVEKKCKYLLSVHGGEFLGHFSWRLTPEASSRGSSCDVLIPNYELREIETTKWKTEIEISVPESDQNIYLCLHHSETENAPFGGKWVHQGTELFLDPKNDGVSDSKTVKNIPQKSNLEEATITFADLSHDTDVNHLPSKHRPTREEARDIEVLIRDKYIPLYDIAARDVKNILRDASKKTVYSKRGFYEENDVRRTKRNDDGKTDDKYLPLSNIDTKDLQNILRDARTTRHSKGNENSFNVNEVRTKRNVTEQSDDLISKEDVIKAKIEQENAIKIVKQEENHEDALIKIRKARQVVNASGSVVPVIKIEGLRVEAASKDPRIAEGGVPSVLAETSVTLRLFGEGLTDQTIIAFTYEAQNYGEPCKFLVKGEYLAKMDATPSKSALIDIYTPPPSATNSKLYVCAKNLKPGNTDPNKDDEKYIHQGKEPFKILAIHDKLLPLWVAMVLILTCLTFSALFSGLNLGLMSLDRTELKIISNTGTEQERKYARAIMPVRDHGNYLLCSILLGNVAVNSTFTILLDELTSGLFAVIFSTLSIVLLGEITPQAICSRHGLMIGAKSIMITKAVMAITAPLAYPVSKLLDYFLGEEIGSVYNRERLKELVKVTTDVNDLDKDEVNIISGALELRKKKVTEVMTKLEDVFMLPITSVLDFETMSEIVKSGFSRIPVYEGHRSNIVTVLFIKDLAFVDPDDNTPLRTLCQYYQNACNFVFEDVTLDVMFKQFKEGHKGHMAFVHRINNEGEGDPFYETIGLVTLEDVIEEMIQAEIVDETDVFMDNRTKRRRNRPNQNKLADFAAFAERHENQRIHISPQLTLATFQFLSSSVDAFRPDTVSETVLRRLLKQDVIQYIKLKGKTKKDPSTFVFHQGKPVDYFVLILEGRVEVTVGRENLVFEAGPFTYFGVQALTQNVGVAESPTPSAKGSLQNINMDAMLRHTFVPDYSVRAITELYYLTVKRSLYLAAKRATLMEKGALSKGATTEQFDTEVDKHLTHSTLTSSGNIPISLLSKKLLGNTTTESTVSTKDYGSSSSVDKSNTRLNIIELMQISPLQKYASSEQLDECDECSGECLSNMSNKLSNIDLSSAMTCDVTCNLLKSLSSSRLTNKCHFQDQCLEQVWSKEVTTKSVVNKCGTGEVDANSCDVCRRNNFWMNRSILNKSVEEDNTDDHKRKRTTFHTDPSLLTFHDLPAQDPQCSITFGGNNAPLLGGGNNAPLFGGGNIDPLDDFRREKKLLQSVDEDTISINVENRTPSRQVSPNPVSASPLTRSSFVSRGSPERDRNGDLHYEHEKLLKSP